MDAIDDLYRLTLVDGIAVERDGKTLRYRVVHLRETTVADERAATRMAERVVMVAGAPKLLVSEADFRYALTLRHIERLECDGLVLQGPVLDLDLLGKLSPHDLGLIEERVFLITMSAEVRYGLLSQADFDALLAGTQPKAPVAPQPLGQAAELGRTMSQPGPGPALLADFAGDVAGGPAAGDGC